MWLINGYCSWGPLWSHWNAVHTNSKLHRKWCERSEAIYMNTLVDNTSAVNFYTKRSTQQAGRKWKSIRYVSLPRFRILYLRCTAKSIDEHISDSQWYFSISSVEIFTWSMISGLWHAIREKTLHFVPSQPDKAHYTNKTHIVAVMWTLYFKQEQVETICLLKCTSCSSNFASYCNYPVRSLSHPSIIYLP